MYPSLRKYLYWSLIGHLTAFLFILVIPGLFFKAPKFNREKIVWVSVPKGTTNQLGSPLKKSEGLPQTTIEEQKKALESPPAGEKKSGMTYKQQQEKKTAKKPPPKKPGHPDSRIENALARVSKEVAKKQASPEAAQVPETQPGGFTFGNSNGPYVSPEDPEYVLYQLKIRQKIIDQWILPVKYAEQPTGLLCRIVVHMNERGEVIETEWETKSGNPSFDMSALRAVEKASPLDIPPERLKNEVYNEGFIIEFNPSLAKQSP